MNMLLKISSTLTLVTIAAGLIACSSDTTPSSSSGSTSGGSSSGSTSGAVGGACTGEITACKMGTLSDTQQGDMCSLILASIDAPAGTKFECKEGDKADLFLTVNTKEQCVATKAPAACKVTVGELVECYKSAKKDACAAFADTGACAPLFASDSGCTP